MQQNVLCFSGVPKQFCIPCDPPDVNSMSTNELIIHYMCCNIHLCLFGADSYIWSGNPFQQRKVKADHNSCEHLRHHMAEGKEYMIWFPPHSCWCFPCFVFFQIWCNIAPTSVLLASRRHEVVLLFLKTNSLILRLQLFSLCAFVRFLLREAKCTTCYRY